MHTCIESGPTNSTNLVVDVILPLNAPSVSCLPRQSRTRPTRGREDEIVSEILPRRHRIVIIFGCPIADRLRTPRDATQSQRVEDNILSSLTRTRLPYERAFPLGAQVD